MFTLNEVLDNTIFGISTNLKGNKEVYFCGYGYTTDENEEGLCGRFIEYTGACAPLSKVLKNGFDAVEEELVNSVNAYITDCTEDDIVDIYEHYDNGKPPKVLEKLSKSTPDGVYILKRSEDKWA